MIDMGCWNKTCGLTNLPIFSGEEVIWFLLVQSPNSPQARSCYSNGAWELIPVPIYGTYDDYGFIQPNNGQEWKLKLFNNFFHESLVKLNNGGYGEHVTNPFETFQMLNNSLRNDSYAIKEQKYTKDGVVSVNCLFGDFFVHKASFDELTERYQMPWGDEIYTREQIESSVKKFYEFRNKQIVEKPTDIPFHYFLRLNNIIVDDDLLDEFISTLDIKPKYKHHYCGSNVISYWMGAYSQEIGYITKRFISYITEYSTKQNTLTIKEQIDVALLHSVIDGLRKSYYPQGHEGSQDDIWSLHEQFAQTYINRINDRKSMFDE